MDNIEEEFSQILNYLSISNEQIRMDASFVDDFDFEESQFDCLAFYIETYFKIKIKKEEYTELHTIGSAMDFVKRKLDLN